MANFKAIIDGEEAILFTIPEPFQNGEVSEYLDKLIAALSSDPVIVKIED